MMLSILLTAHIVVLGYWLGSELVINATYRLVCYADDMPFAQRDRLMEHVMHVDQHVRYALVLQTALGLMLAASYGFVPGGRTVVAGAAAFGVCWLVFIEAVHRLRHRQAGRTLAKVDRISRYLLMALLLAVALGLLGQGWPVPLWLRWKLAAFAAVIACGVGIRLALLSHFRTWAQMAAGKVTAANNAIIQRTYVIATSVLGLLWLCLAVVTYLSIAKPGL